MVRAQSIDRGILQELMQDEAPDRVLQWTIKKR